jgi:CHAD domain-containing protein
MNREEIGVFLFRFYRKRTTSFLANIYKASITGESKDIHRARLDVKKIFALYGLFEMVAPSAFKHQGGYKLFRPLYRQAGKIREIQVNYLLLNAQQPPDADYTSFVLWLRDEERRAIYKYLQLVKKFRESELTDTEKLIQKICHSSSIFKLRSKTEAYIKSKAAIVKDLQLSEPGDKEIHKIRQQLKSMSTIATLVYSIKPGKHLDLLVTSFNKTEMMIGDWHDRVVLKEAIERFLSGNTLDLTESSAELNSLNLLKQGLIDYNLNLVQHFMPEVNGIVEAILTKES